MSTAAPRPATATFRTVTASVARTTSKAIGTSTSPVAAATTRATTGKAVKLSRGGTIGLGVGIAILVIVIIVAILIFLYIRRSKAKEVALAGEKVEHVCQPALPFDANAPTYEKGLNAPTAPPTNMAPYEALDAAPARGEDGIREGEGPGANPGGHNRG